MLFFSQRHSFHHVSSWQVVTLWGFEFGWKSVGPGNKDCIVTVYCEWCKFTLVHACLCVQCSHKTFSSVCVIYNCSFLCVWTEYRVYYGTEVVPPPGGSSLYQRMWGKACCSGSACSVCLTWLLHSMEKLTCTSSSSPKLDQIWP